VAEGITHLEVPDGALDRAFLADLGERLVVTPWKSLVATSTAGR
jgi:hypothetical protein